MGFQAGRARRSEAKAGACRRSLRPAAMTSAAGAWALSAWRAISTKRSRQVRRLLAGNLIFMVRTLRVGRRTFRRVILSAFDDNSANRALPCGSAEARGGDGDGGRGDDRGEEGDGDDGEVGGDH